MTTEEDEPDFLQYFSGGVPTGHTFCSVLEDLDKTIDRSAKGLSRVNEVCFIGLVAYFEAFCKDQFSAILNIEPTLLSALRENGQDTQIDPSRLLEFRDEWVISLGFLVSEKYDFGTAQKINALYGALLKVTPFSKDDARYYSEILRDRNLLVHHGGTLTLAYALQSKALKPHMQSRPFFDSLLVTPTYFDERLRFISDIARKILKITHTALATHVAETGLSYSPKKTTALNALEWWDIAE